MVLQILKICEIPRTCHQNIIGEKNDEFDIWLQKVQILQDTKTKFCWISNIRVVQKSAKFVDPQESCKMSICLTAENEPSKICQILQKRYFWQIWGKEVLQGVVRKLWDELDDDASGVISLAELDPYVNQIVNQSLRTLAERPAERKAERSCVR